MKNILLLISILFSSILYSQIGIGTTDPKSTLDIRSTSISSPSNTDGILIPKMNNYPIVNPTIDQDGMLIFITGNGTPEKGLYYWDNTTTTWVGVGSGEVEKIDDLLDGKSDTNGSSVFVGLNAGINDDGTLNENAGFGFQALNGNTNGDRNVAVGYVALRNNTTGSSNTAVGRYSLFTNTTGTFNTAFGSDALQSNSNGSYNTGVGGYSLLNNNGASNTAVGAFSLHYNTSGSNNTAIGVLSLQDNTTGGWNTGIGEGALKGNTIGNFGTSLGYRALFNNTSGTENTAAGNEALYQNISGSSNVALGGRALRGNVTGNGNVALGTSAGYFETGSNKLYIENSNANSNNALIYGEFDNNLLKINGDLVVDNGAMVVEASTNNVGIDTAAPNAKLDIRINAAAPSNTDGILIPKANNFPTTNPGVNQDGMLLFLTGTGTPEKGFYYWDNTATTWVGVGSGGAEKIDDLLDGKSDNNGSSVFLGLNAGDNDNQTSNQNVGVGFQALNSNTGGEKNTAIGYVALLNSTTGQSNTGIGNQVLYSNTTGNSNVGIGASSLYSNTLGYNNTAVGLNSMYFNTSGVENTAVGQRSLYNNTTGRFNTAIGNYSLSSNVSGYYNTAIGDRSLGGNVTGERNTSIGYWSGLTGGGSFNVYLGYNSGRTAGGSGNVFLGYDSGRNETGSNKLYIENSGANANSALIYGEFDTNLLRINGTLNINNSYNFPTLDGAANQVLRTNGAGALGWVDGSTLGGVEEIDDLLDGKTDASSLFLGTGAGSNDDGTNNNNTAVGQLAMTANTTGNDNTALGALALAANTTGLLNTAVGSSALRFNTSGHNNSAYGHQTLQSNVNGTFNSAIGRLALASNISGHYNVALGFRSAFENETGLRNVAIGTEALFADVSGQNNTGIGYRAGYFNQGSNNVFLGYLSGYNETGSNKLYIDNSATADPLVYGEFDNNMLRVNGKLELPSTTDASGTVGTGVLEIASALRIDGNEILTNTNTPLYLQHYNNGDLHIDNTTLFIDASADAVGIGTTAPNATLDIRATSVTNPSNTEGLLIPKVNNFPTTNPGATQDGMLLFLTGNGTPEKGFYYWSNGLTSWVGVSGAERVNDLADGKTDATSLFLGLGAGSNDDGTNNYNTGIGINAFFNNTTGIYNTALGGSSLQDNTTGGANTAIGLNALRFNVSGGNNNAHGYQALQNNINGNFNSAIGRLALGRNISGSNNVAMGYHANWNNLSGIRSCAIGDESLANNTANYNTALGYGSLVSVTTGSNNTGIGHNAQVPSGALSNQVRIGNTLVTYAGVQVGWSITSDQRWKDQIQDLPYGLNFISKLKPVHYIRKNNEENTREIGFIAQEVRDVLTELGYADQGMLTEADNGYLSLRYNDFVPVLVKALQEQQQEIDELKAQLDKFEALESRIQALETADQQ